MKILHIINHMGMGGAQSLLVELAPVQKDMGHDVLVLELESTKDRTLVNKLKDKGVEVKSVSASRSVRNPLNVFSLIPYLKACDVAHAHLFPANYWTALAKIVCGCKTPIITTEHSTNNKRRNIPIFKYIDAFIYNRYQKVVACADKALETFKARYPKTDCVSIPNGVDISKYKNAQPYAKQEFVNVAEDKFIVTMVARFDYPKRQDTLVEAMALLPEKFHAVLVGGTADDVGLQKAQKLSQDLGVSDRVHFLYLRSDVPRILKSSDVVVMSSEYEGLSLSSIEGMACGHPFLATNVNGLREVVGGAGQLFECGNAHELARVLQRFESDKDFYCAVTNKCLARAEEYDIQSVASKYQGVYNKFVKTKWIKEKSEIH